MMLLGRCSLAVSESVDVDIYIFGSGIPRGVYKCVIHLGGKDHWIRRLYMSVFVYSFSLMPYIYTYMYVYVHMYKTQRQ